MTRTRQFYKEPDTIRAMPQDSQAEQAVLGAMLINQEMADTILDILQEGDFYREQHRMIFKAVKSLREEKKPIDMITLKDELSRTGEFESVGGVSALTELLRTPTSANGEYYAQIVKDKAHARKIITAATQVVTDAYEDSMPIKELMDTAEARIFEATDQRGAEGFVQIKDLIGNSLDTLYKISERGHHITGVPTGFEELDILTGGLQPGHLIVIGGRPSVGKTALGLNIAWNAASGKNHPTGKKFSIGLFSIEMNEEEIGNRLLCSVGEVNWHRARQGELLESDKKRLRDATARIYDAPIHVNDSSSLTVMELKAEARRLKKQFDIELIIVDYLQLLYCGQRFDTREQEVAFISRHLKSLAKALKIPVLCMAQLRRPQQGNEEKRPTLSDLRESGAIEADADVVIFIHREKMVEGGEKHFKYELHLAKQRNGPIGDIPIHFDAWCTRFKTPEAKDVRVQE